MSLKKQGITFKYVFAYNFNPVYVNGAQGGVSPRGEIVVNFYLERPALPNSLTHEINPNGTIGAEIGGDPEDLKSSLVRFIETGVVFNHETASMFHNWLGDRIKELETMMEAKASFEQEQQPENKGATH